MSVPVSADSQQILVPELTNTTKLPQRLVVASLGTNNCSTFVLINIIEK